MYVNIIAKTDCKILSLPLTTLNHLVNKYAESNKKNATEKEIEEEKKRAQFFSTRVLIAQNRFSGGASYPVDYIKMENPNKFDSYLRKNLLKNVVMRIVLETRERKKKPRLGEVLHVYRSHKTDENASYIKEEFQQKFIKLYSGEEKDSDNENEKDVKYKLLF